MVRMTPIQAHVVQLAGYLGELEELRQLPPGARIKLSQCIAIAKLILEEESNDNKKANAGKTLIRSSTKDKDFMGEPHLPHRDPSDSINLDLESYARTDADDARRRGDSDNQEDDR